ncbi:MAG TPA: pyridoxamine 5'-phosphate oxidase family protein, partial [Candidatus Hungatella pullicola]|nr:pyridoxamine 5'-phosphate oxidase family protein [Candidatus Hungatella pullicola]
MDAETCLRKLQYVGVLAFATVDEYGNPQVRNISAIHYESNAMYFFTARGKAFCRELLSDGRVQILGYTKYKEMIRLAAKAVPVPQEDQKKWIDTIFSEQPYLSNVYPGDTRNIGIVFEIRDAEIEYFHLGVNPIFRESYVIGNGNISVKGYQIADTCIGCGKCAENCPQRCRGCGQKVGLLHIVTNDEIHKRTNSYRVTDAGFYWFPKKGYRNS